MLDSLIAGVPNFVFAGVALWAAFVLLQRAFGVVESELASCRSREDKILELLTKAIEALQKAQRETD